MSRNKETPIKPSRHPSEAELRLYVRGRDCGWELNQLEAHLLLCPECQAKVDELDSWRRK